MNFGFSVDWRICMTEMKTSHQICIIFMLIIILATGESGLSPYQYPLENHPVAEPHRGPEGCHFPGRWEGNWFQSGVHVTITISRNAISNKGTCLDLDGEKYLLHNQRDNCYRCVVFHEKHRNLLQYKETFCVPERASIRNLCSTITGDANLFAMFRLDAQAIDCPFRAPLSFTYNRGHGECRNPVSTMESCMQSSRLLFNYQACPDIPGTESSVEELECLASWKEGSYRYLVGLIQYRHHASYEERFRCFAYEKVKKGSPGLLGHFLPRSSPLTFNSSSTTTNVAQAESSTLLYRVAQSGDATCNGLTPYDGSKTILLKRGQPMKKCYFPSWVQVAGPWRSLDQGVSFVFNGSSMWVTNSSASSPSASSICSQVKSNPSPKEFIILLHSTSDQCRNGFMCMRIVRRDSYVVETQLGTLTRQPDDACHPRNFNVKQLPFLTLTSSMVIKRRCPSLGHFGVTSLVQEGRSVRDTCNNARRYLSVGCSDRNTLELKASCSTKRELVSEYLCHGSWEENGVNYLITTMTSKRNSVSRKFCFVYKEIPISSQSEAYQEKYTQRKFDEHEEQNLGRVLQFSSIADSCRRDVLPGVEGHLAFNVTSQGKCNDISLSSRTTLRARIMYFSLAILLVLPGVE